MNAPEIEAARAAAQERWRVAEAEVAALVARLRGEPGSDPDADADNVLAGKMMALAEAYATQGPAFRLAVMAAAWRCVAGVHARLAMDMGVSPAGARATLMQGAIEAGVLAELVVRGHHTTGAGR